jgi:hypothetical protein
LVGAEHDVGRVEGQVVELGVGRQVGCTRGGKGGDPADGAGEDACLWDVSWSLSMGFVDERLEMGSRL